MNDLVFKLKEISPDSLAIGADKLSVNLKDIEIIENKTVGGAVDWFAIRSDQKTYDTIKLMDIFAACSCPDFTFGQNACKHIAFIMPTKCTRCRKVLVNGYSEKCDHCTQATAPYLKSSGIRKPVTMIGKIRI